MSAPCPISASSPRRRGPITPGGSDEARHPRRRINERTRRMGPRLRGTTCWRLRPAFALLALLATFIGSTAPASAHPHVWVIAASELIYAADGSISGVRHAWTFDDMFSTYALQGIETKTKGVYTREELAPLAQTNVESLKEFGFFTFAKADGKKEKFLEPVDYFLEHKDGALVLHFTLPFKTPFKTKAACARNVTIRASLSISRSRKRIRSGWSARRRPARWRSSARMTAAPPRRSSTSRRSRTARIPITARCSPTRSRWIVRERPTSCRCARFARTRILTIAPVSGFRIACCARIPA